MSESSTPQDSAGEPWTFRQDGEDYWHELCACLGDAPREVIVRKVHRDLRDVGDRAFLVQLLRAAAGGLVDPVIAREAAALAECLEASE